jgi:hypothetical protein
LLTLILTLPCWAFRDRDLRVKDRRANLQRMSYRDHVFKRDDAFAPFNAAYVVTLKVTHLRERVL